MEKELKTVGWVTLLLGIFSLGAILISLYFGKSSGGAGIISSSGMIAIGASFLLGSRIIAKSEEKRATIKIGNDG